MCEVGFSLLEESSRARQDTSRVRYSECGTYMTLELIYSMGMSQGCTKNENNTRKEQRKEHRRLCRIIVQQENERQLDTIRVRAIE